MTSKTFTVTAVVFWLTSMSWLVQQKILPSLLIGDPPSYRQLLIEQQRHPEPVGWRISLNDNPLGWAISYAVRDSEGGQEFNTRLVASQVPLKSLAPVWLSSLMRTLERQGSFPDVRVDVDVGTRLGLDALGQPFALDSTAVLGYRGAAQQLAEGYRIRMEGKIAGSQMILQVRTGDAVYSPQFFLPRDALVSDALSPQARLPGLRVGQQWTVPLYNPFRSPTNPVEVLQAAVERRADIIWNDENVNTLLVVYRSDSGSELTSQDMPRGRCWVAGDGRVLRQELQLGAARLVFDRVETAPANWVPDRVVDPQKLIPWWVEKP
jgi:hypothetical protein